MPRWRACCWGRRGVRGFRVLSTSRWNRSVDPIISYVLSCANIPIQPPTDALAGGGGVSSSLAARGLESHRGVNLSQSVRNDLVRSEKQAGARATRHTGRDERATTEQVCYVCMDGWMWGGGRLTVSTNPYPSINQGRLIE